MEYSMYQPDFNLLKKLKYFKVKFDFFKLNFKTGQWKKKSKMGIRYLSGKSHEMKKVFDSLVPQIKLTVIIWMFQSWES